MLVRKQDKSLWCGISSTLLIFYVSFLLLFVVILTSAASLSVVSSEDENLSDISLFNENSTAIANLKWRSFISDDQEVEVEINFQNLTSWANKTLAAIFKENDDNRQGANPLTSFLGPLSNLFGGGKPLSQLGSPASLCYIKYAVCVTVVYGARKCCAGLICPIFKLFKCEANQRKRALDGNTNNVQNSTTTALQHIRSR